MAGDSNPRSQISPFVTDNCRFEDIQFGTTPPYSTTRYQWQMLVQNCSGRVNDIRVSLLFLKLHTTDGNNSVVHLLDSSALMCKPTYSITAALASYSSTAGVTGDVLTVSRIPQASPRELPGLDESAIFDTFHSSLLATEVMGNFAIPSTNDTLMSWLVANRQSKNKDSRLA